MMFKLLVLIGLTALTLANPVTTDFPLAPRPAGVIVIGTNEQRSVFDDNVCRTHIDIKQYYIKEGFTCSFYDNCSNGENGVLDQVQGPTRATYSDDQPDGIRCYGTPI
ncbi:hypothetical protein BDV96DRAFT_641329 [Lophiotrema nucula]|uniref:Uncharacterized protein n=1 Tax=Lophiotrema nucula TaxID=690887 RepID=A0A6A5ZP51_9PLEO|nr:hypothetical protein BDV96DRAFT_641329 [Lophiotrema nucula]